MIIAATTIGFIVCAFLVSLLPSDIIVINGIVLKNGQIYYLILAISAFTSGLMSRSMLYGFLGTLLFARWTLENLDIQDWTSILVLFYGHMSLALVTFCLVRGAKDPFLYYFPALMACQGLSDILFYVFEYPYYGYLHNVLAIMQMSAFIVLAWQTRKRPLASDPISELINQWMRQLYVWMNSKPKTQKT